MRRILHLVILGSPCGGSKLQGTSPVLSGVTCVGGQGRSQTKRLLGPQSGWCVPDFSSCRGRTHCGVVWSLSGLLAHCQACGAALMGSGQGHIRQGGSARCTGAGGAGLACFVVSGPLREGPCSTRREAGPSEGWIHRNIALGVCVVQASLVTGTGSLWNFGWGMGDGNGACQHLCSPAKLSSVFLGSTTLPPGVLSPSPLSKSRAVDFNIPDVKSGCLSELTEFGPSTFASQTLGTLPCQAGYPSTAPAPSRQSA